MGWDDEYMAGIAARQNGTKADNSGKDSNVTVQQPQGREIGKVRISEDEFAFLSSAVLLLLFLVSFFVVKRKLRKWKTTRLQRVGFLLVSFALPIYLIPLLVVTVAGRYYIYELPEIFSLSCYAAFALGLLLISRIPQKIWNWIKEGEPD